MTVLGEKGKLVYNTLKGLLDKRIVVLDGGMGTMLQKYKLEEDSFRGTEFAQWPKSLKGNNDLLSLTQPNLVEAIHKVISVDFLLTFD